MGAGHHGRSTSVRGGLWPVRGTRMRLELPEPPGSRVLFDASQYPPRPITTEDPA